MLDLRPAAARLCAWLWSRAAHAVVPDLRQVPRGRTPEDADGTGRTPSLGEERDSDMAGSVNKVILIGNLGKDPDVRTTQAGSKIVSFTLATSETWSDRASGERKERTEWHRVVVFNNELIADIAERYLTKDVKVYVEGQLQTRK
jgi:hypothetical protein